MKEKKELKVSQVGRFVPGEGRNWQAQIAGKLVKTDEKPKAQARRTETDLKSL